MRRAPKSFIAARGKDAARLARPEVLELMPYRGGKSLDETKRETGLRSFVKLASNENPLGPSPLAQAAIRRAIREVHQYPDSGYPLLRNAIARRYRIRPEQVILGDGSNEVLVLTCNAFLRPGDEAVFATPSFVVFGHAVRGAGGKPVTVPLRGLKHDLPAMAKAAGKHTRLVFVCNPNNPTGTIVSRREVDAFLRALPGGVIVVFDEAYAEFVDDRSYPDSLDYVRRDLMVVVVRTFAKLYGLAGLRIGYGVGPVALIDVLERLRQPYNVSCVAYRAAVAALKDRRYVNRALRCVREGRRWLAREFGRLGLEAVPSHANFVLVRTGIEGARVADAMLRRGVIVRPLPGSLLRRYVRVTVGTRAQNRAVIRELEAVLAREG